MELCKAVGVESVPNSADPMLKRVDYSIWLSSTSMGAARYSYRHEAQFRPSSAANHWRAPDMIEAHYVETVLSRFLSIPRLMIRFTVANT